MHGWQSSVLELDLAVLTLVMACVEADTLAATISLSAKTILRRNVLIDNTMMGVWIVALLSINTNCIVIATKIASRTLELATAQSWRGLQLDSTSLSVTVV